MIDNQVFNHLRKQGLFLIIIVIISLLAYSAVLIIGIPREIGLAARYSLIPVLTAIAVLLYPAYRQPGWIGILASFSLTLILFGLPLSGLWSLATSENYVLGGLLPETDANGYYHGARRLLEGSTLSIFSSRRPLFAGFLATLLGLTQQNLQVTLAILVALNAISCFLLTREVQRSHGTVPGLLVLTTLFLFYRQFIGTTMSENLGFALGTTGMALLWHGTLKKGINLCLLGILLFTLALNARAGAFFILPALVLWGAWSFRGSSRFSQRFLIGGISAVLLGFILNSILLKTVGNPDGMANSNFSYVLYGLIVGGNWTTVRADHPEILSLSEPELSHRIYTLAFEAFRANPLGLVSGSIRAWKQFIGENFIFSFINDVKLNFCLQILSVIALFACYRHRHIPLASLMIAATVGIFLSVPFVPPWDGGIRIYAATIPVFSILPGLGLVSIARKIKGQKLVQLPNPNNKSRVLLMFSLGLVLLVFVGPIAIKNLSKPPKLADASCPLGKEIVYFRNSLGSSINLVADDSIQSTYLPNVSISDFRKRLQNFYRVELAKELGSLTHNTTLINAFNLKNSQSVMLIADSNLIPKENGVVASVCGKLTTNPTNQRYRIFHADSIPFES